MGGTIINRESEQTKWITRDTVLYRTVRLNRLLSMFSAYQNALVRPKLWDDTFENYALNSDVEIDGKSGKFGFRDDIYGQCWTRESFSDAMWRIYSNGTDGVRIKTTVGKLLDSLSRSAGTKSEISCFIGKVRYCKDEGLNQFAESHFADGLGSDGKQIAETLLLKRNAFRHEKEVRLIYLAPETQPPEKDLHLYHFDPHELIDQIMVHPQLSEEEADTLKKRIREATNYKGEVKRSLLYRTPKGFLFKVKM